MLQPAKGSFRENGPTLLVAFCSGFLVAALAGISSPTVEAAESYPVRTVRMIVGPGPGSGTDVVARAIAQKLTERMKHTVFVENRPGAGGTIATDAVAKSAPDGHTLLFSSGSLVVTPWVYRKLPFDVVKDLDPIVLVGVVPQVLIVHPSVPAKNVRELIALAKRLPGELAAGSGGIGTTGHLATELFQSSAGIHLTHVPYKGAGPAGTDLIAGNIVMLFTAVVHAQRLSRARTVRLLGVTSLTRLKAMPELPTLNESGVPGYEMGSWYGVLAASGTPRPVIERLNREFSGVLNLPDINERLKADSVELLMSTPEEFGAFIKTQLERVGKIIRAAKIPQQ